MRLTRAARMLLVTGLVTAGAAGIIFVGAVWLDPRVTPLGLMALGATFLGVVLAVLGALLWGIAVIRRNSGR